MSVHFVDEGADTGPIICKGQFRQKDDTLEILAARVLQEEHRIYPEAIKLYAEGDYKLMVAKVKIKSSKEEL